MAVIVLGAGIVGLTCANLLANNSDLEIILIDKKPLNFEHDAKFYDLRCSAINLASKQIWQDLDVWGAILNHRVGMYQRMVVWDRVEHNRLVFDATELSRPNLGFIVENRVILQELYRNINNRNNVEQIYGEVNDLCIDSQQVKLNINDRQITADLIIGADGANSWLRNTANILCTTHDYKQDALVATIYSEISHQNTAWQRFTDTGNLAFLPLDEQNTSSIVWVSNSLEIRQLLDQDPQQFCKKLADTFDNKLGALTLLGERASFKLRRQDSKRYVAQRMALIGDAAHVMHPMAGLGLNTGIHDAALLAQYITGAHLAHEDLGSELLLRRYERNAKSANAMILDGIDHLHKIFSSSNSLLGLIRGTGVRILNEVSFAKKLLANVALGGYNRDFI